MQKRTRIAALALALALPLTAASTGVAHATNPPATGQEGCTPGYWKNHVESWDEYSPDQTVGSVFNITGALGDATLLEALDFGGGSDLEGAQQILLRAAVAALLNSVDDVVAYPLRENGVINRTNRALASGDRTTILNRANAFDRRNNLGCPL